MRTIIQLGMQLSMQLILRPIIELGGPLIIQPWK